jgi:uncharacterized coiled-coil DUF342 family protein
MEDVKRYQAGEYNVECTKGIIKPTDIGMVHNLCDTIEALQQELAGWESRYTELDAGHSKLFKVFCELKQENERLKGAIQEWVDGVCISQKYLFQIGKLQQENDIFREDLDDANAQMAYRDKVIGELKAQNGAMREAMKQAKEALEISNNVSVHWLNSAGQKIIEDALVKISEVVGE